MEQESYEALWNRALWYLGRRDYGSQELRQKLLRPRPNKPLPPEDGVDRAIERLLELNLLDDARYAQRLAQALSRKGVGERGIAMELRRRGVAEEPELPVSDEQRLAELLRTKYQRKLGDERGRRSVYQSLVRKGFRHADIRCAMRDFMEEETIYGEDILEE